MLHVNAQENWWNTLLYYEESEIVQVHSCNHSKLELKFFYKDGTNNCYDNYNNYIDKMCNYYGKKYDKIL